MPREVFQRQTSCPLTKQGQEGVIQEVFENLSWEVSPPFPMKGAPPALWVLALTFWTASFLVTWSNPATDQPCSVSPAPKPGLHPGSSQPSLQMPPWPGHAERSVCVAGRERALGPNFNLKTGNYGSGHGDHTFPSIFLNLFLKYFRITSCSRGIDVYLLLQHMETEISQQPKLLPIVCESGLN